MQEVAPGTYRLGSKQHNFYLVAEGGKATVIDAGCSKEIGKLDAALAALNMARSDVEVILLTHAHADHIGFAAEAADGGTAVKAHVDEAPIARGEARGHAVQVGDLPLWRPPVWGFLFALLKAGVRTAPRVKSIETFDDGERLDIPGHPRVIHTPGHTPGHAVFYLEGPKTVFTGDGLVTMNVLGGRKGPQMLPPLFHTDEDLARRSLVHLESLDTKYVLPGHGSPWRGQAADAVRAIPT
ncbi:MAG: MBL fold metallo-hydrolase [Acidimicrobiia bacterium]|nr:MBL fold metallo-hydrolase [Acidimicrobiia bacterium]